MSTAKRPTDSPTSPNQRPGDGLRTTSLTCLWVCGVLLSCPAAFAGRELNGGPPIAWSRLRQQWHLGADRLMPVTPIVVAVLCLVAALAIMWGWRSGRLPGRRWTRLKVYRRVIGDFGFSGAEKRLLVSIARQQRLPSPLALLLSAATFEHHAQAFGQTVRPQRRGRFDTCVAHIRQVVFGPDAGR